MVETGRQGLPMQGPADLRTNGEVCEKCVVCVGTRRCVFWCGVRVRLVCDELLKLSREMDVTP